MEQVEFFSDICAGRHSGNKQSAVANVRNRKVRRHQRATVLRHVKKAKGGATCREVARTMDVGMNQISGRFTELKEKNLIRKVGQRDGCAVYVVN